jgi:hypothetical protein
MASAPTTKLQAINTILSSVGESPITSLDYISDSASATIALNILDEVDRSFQSRGWSFNTDISSTLTKDASNFISVPSNVIRVNVSETTYPTIKVVLRGTKLYDSKGKTFVFSSNITGEVVSLLDFELIPEPARNFITIRSSRLFNIRTRPEEAQAKITEVDEQLAFSTFLEFEVRTGIDLNFLKYSPELDALGINQAVFLSSTADDKLKLIQTSASNLAERQGRLYYQNRVEGKTTATSDNFSTYIEGFRRLGITEKDFLGLDPLQKEEALVIAKGATSSSTTDTRASKFFASGVADKARKLGIRYSEFCQLPNEAQQVFLDGVTSLNEDRFSRFITNQAKAIKIGVRITNFITLKPEEQETLLDALSSATYSDTRTTDYVSNQEKFKSLGIYPLDFFKLSPEEQSLLLSTIPTFTEDRFTRFVTNQNKALRIGVRITDFLVLSPQQQETFLDTLSSSSYFDARAETYAVHKSKLDKLGINPQTFFSLKPEEQTNLLTAVAETNFTDTRVTSYVTNQTKLKSLGIYPADFFTLTYDQQTLVLDAVNSASYTETRATSYITNQAKLKKIGIWPGDFFALKIDQQNLLLDTLTSASWSDTRATDYVTNQAKLKSIGVYPQDFLLLKPEQQVLLIESIATFTEDRISRFNTASIQTNLKKLGIDLVKFLALPKDQQNLLLDGASGLDNIISSQSNAILTFESVNIYGKYVNQALRYLGIPPISSFTTSDTGYTALKIITEIDILIQSEGWHFNTEKGITLAPNQYGNINPSDSVAYQVLSFDVDKYEDYKYNIVLRGDYLYNVAKQTEEFTSNVKGDLVCKIDFNQIPPVFQRYIVIRTAKELAPILGKSDFMKNLLLEESRARMEAIQYDSENADYSMFDTYDVARVLDRSTGNSSIAY